jgi:hypothetical protein
LAYELSGADRLAAWLASEPDPATRVAVVEAVRDLVADPKAAEGDAQPVPGEKLPMMTRFVPGTDVALTWFIANLFWTVVLSSVESVPRP